MFYYSCLNLWTVVTHVTRYLQSIAHLDDAELNTKTRQSSMIYLHLNSARHISPSTYLTRAGLR